jgi:hypothetical protein
MADAYISRRESRKLPKQKLSDFTFPLRITGGNLEFGSTDDGCFGPVDS